MSYPYGPPQYPDPNSGGYPQYGYPPQLPARTNGLAIASMVLSLVGVALLCAWGAGGLPALLGVIFGHVARGQIRRERTEGGGMAMAGLVIGYCVIGLAALVIVFVVIWGVALFSFARTSS